jgi:phosphoribosylformylglycinamidine synthase
MIAVSEASRNISCTGALPVAVTNCLNFGNPYNPEVYWQFVQAIKGMGEACLKFDTPVTGGNVSFYNQSVYADKTEPVYPTPTIGMIGIIEQISGACTAGFKDTGDLIYLLGTVTDDLGCSEYLHLVKGVSLSPVPYFDLDEELKLHAMVRNLISSQLVQSAHDVSEGGLFISLMESGMQRGLGFEIRTHNDLRIDAFLFGEGQGRVVVSVKESQAKLFEDAMGTSSVPVMRLGHVTEGTVQVGKTGFGSMDEWKELYDNVLHTYLEN